MIYCMKRKLKKQNQNNWCAVVQAKNKKKTKKKNNKKKNKQQNQFKTGLFSLFMNATFKGLISSYCGLKKQLFSIYLLSLTEVYKGFYSFRF